MHNFSRIIFLSAIIIILLAGGAAGTFYYFSRQKIKVIDSFEKCVAAGYPLMESYPSRCALPDGRVFAEILEKSGKGILEGKVTIGPFCPVERFDSPCPIPPGTYISRQAVVYQSDGKTEVVKVSLDQNGNYRLELSPGDYLVDIVPGAGIAKSVPKAVIIQAGQTAKLNFDLDTGVR